jgi:hypothetical protein
MSALTPIRTVLTAVQKHTMLMSPVLLEYLLRGDVIGRMSEKDYCRAPFTASLLPSSATKSPAPSVIAWSKGG